MSEGQARDLRVGRLAALDEPVRRRLFDYVQRSSEPVRREDAADAAGISRSLAAYHLDRLADLGLLKTTYRRPPGRGGPGAGRPAKLYEAAESEVAVSVPQREYELAARLLAQAADEGASRRVAADEGRELGAALRRERPDVALRDVLAARGYEPHEDEAGVTWLESCPFHRLAEEHRTLVCGMNQAYLQGMLEGLERDDVTASLEPEPGRCCVAIRAAARP
jgi:predicted ArsR family transcriptional regulator